jgi:plasmid maintenance system killer protein
LAITSRGAVVTSIPAGDYSRFIEAVNNIPDSYFYSKLVQQIKRCDTAERKTEVASTPSTRLEKIEGDVDRTVSSSNAQEALKVWAQIYLFETNRLAQMLYIPNYKDEGQARYRFERSGAEFIQALPGPADVAVGTRIMLNFTWM